MYDKYLIQSGDSLETIAKKFNTKEDIILELNNIPFPDMLRAGKEIIVPINKEQYFEYYTIQKGDTIFMGNNEYFLIKKIKKHDIIKMYRIKLH